MIPFSGFSWSNFWRQLSACMVKFRGLAPFLITLLLAVCLEMVLGLPPVKRFLLYASHDYLQEHFDNLTQDDPHNVDILIMGTSRMMCGLKPDVLESRLSQNINVFNLSIPEARFPLQSYVLKSHVHRYGKPRVLILELPELSLNDYGGRDDGLYLATTVRHSPWLLWQVLQDSRLSEEARKSAALGFFSTYSHYKRAFTWEEFRELSRNKRYQSLFLPTDGSSYVRQYQQGWSSREAYNPAKETEEMIKNRIRMRKELLNALEASHSPNSLYQFLELTRSLGIKTVLVQLPTHSMHYRLFESHPVHQKYYDTISKAQKIYGVQFINLSRDRVPENDSLFSDNEDHMDKNGAQVYSAIFAKRLAELPEFQDWQKIGQRQNK